MADLRGRWSTGPGYRPGGRTGRSDCGEGGAVVSRVAAGARARARAGAGVWRVQRPGAGVTRARRRGGWAGIEPWHRPGGRGFLAQRAGGAAGRGRPAAAHRDPPADAAKRHIRGPGHLEIDERVAMRPFRHTDTRTRHECDEMAPTAAQRERIIAELAASQRGVVTTSQLRAAGFDHPAITRRLRAGRLHRLHRGVYLAGHPVAPDGAAELAAVLACGTGSAVSHHTSARLWRLPAFQEWTGPIHVSVPGRDVRHRPGIVVHRVRALAPCDVRQVDGIPATSPARTLLDLASMLPLHDLELTLGDARALGLVSDRELADVLERAGAGRGAGMLRRLLELERSHGLSRSEAERRLFVLVHAAGLPLPKRNARVGRLQVDFLWGREKVVV